MKIAYLGFDLFYDCLEQIYKSGNEIIKIFTCKVDGIYEFSDKVYEFARSNHIDITDKKPTLQDIQLLKESGCELMFSAGYYHLIPVIDSLAGVNIHPAILPVGRGPWPQPVTILRSLKKTGITLHKLANRFDSGDIILQRCFDVTPDDNLETLNDKYSQCAVSLIKDFFNTPMYYLNNAVPQMTGEYWPEPSDDDMTFSLDDDYDRIDRITRAFFGFFCYLLSKDGDKRIKKAFCTRKYESWNDAEEVIPINGGWLVVLKYA